MYFHFPWSGVVAITVLIFGGQTLVVYDLPGNWGRRWHCRSVTAPTAGLWCVQALPLFCRAFPAFLHLSAKLVPCCFPCLVTCPRSSPHMPLGSLIFTHVTIIPNDGHISFPDHLLSTLFSFSFLYPLGLSPRISLILLEYFARTASGGLCCVSSLWVKK